MYLFFKIKQMNTLSVTLVQTYLYWENKKKNLEHFSELLNNIHNPKGLIILPEMFTTGFSSNFRNNAEPFLSNTFDWLKNKAKEKQCAIAGSFIVHSDLDNQYYNRLVFINKNGEYACYDKRHLFRMGNEDKQLNSGKKNITINYQSFRIKPLICYDLRFPVWSRNKTQNGNPTYDCLLYIANWPKSRSHVWKSLLLARALENQCYVIGVNRVGIDGAGLEHSGDSMVISPKGEIIANATPEKEDIISTSIDLNQLNDFRQNFKVALDCDDFNINNEQIEKIKL